MKHQGVISKSKVFTLMIDTLGDEVGALKSVLETIRCGDGVDCLQKVRCILSFVRRKDHPGPLLLVSLYWYVSLWLSFRV